MSYNIVGGGYYLDGSLIDVTDSVTGQNYINGDYNPVEGSYFIFDILGAVQTGSLLEIVPEYLYLSENISSEDRRPLSTFPVTYSEQFIRSEIDSTWYQQLQLFNPQIFDGESYYIDDNSIRYIYNDDVYTRQEFASDGYTSSPFTIYMTYDVVANVVFRRDYYRSEFYYENFKIVKTRVVTYQINYPSNFGIDTFLKVYMKKYTRCCITQCCEPNDYILLT